MQVDEVGADRLMIEFDSQEWYELQRIVRFCHTQNDPDYKVANVAEDLFTVVLEGVRRPGSWERGILQQIFVDYEDSETTE